MTGDPREGGLPGPEAREGRRRGEPRQKRSSRFEIDGWINLDKPTGVSSTQAVGRLKFLFNAKKAGHAGTLDPLASGVLPVAFGEATKTVPVVHDGDKS
jgi:tRNA pseudouridine55 synthase